MNGDHMRFVDEVVEHAAGVDWRRALVFVVAAVPYAVAWTVGKAVTAVLVLFSWVIAAVQAGYTAARGGR